MNVTVLRYIDRIVGVTFLKISSLYPHHVSIPTHPRRILLIKLFGFGNFIFLSPTIKNLRRLYPRATIDVLTFDQNKDICRMYNSYIDTVHTVRFSIIGMSYDIASFCVTHYHNYDIIIDLEQFIRLSAIMGTLLGPRYFVGVSTKNSHKHSAFDLNIPYKEDRHIVEEYYGIVRTLKIVSRSAVAIDQTPQLQRPVVSLNTAYKKLARRILLEKNRRVIVGICSGGRLDDAERRYPPELFAKFVNRLLQDERILIVFFGSRQEESQIQSIRGMLTNPDKTVMYTRLPLEQSAYFVSKTDVFISNDTGPLHLAAALGVFCVGLYGPSKEWVYGPYTSKKIILRDTAHPPIRSNHNEKNTGWNSQWWPSPDKVYKEVSGIIKQIKHEKKIR